MNKFILTTLAVLLMSGVGWLFFQELQANYAKVDAALRTFRWGPAGAGEMFLLASILFATQAWRITVNSLSAPNALTFSASIPVVNIPSFAKYLPGKLWSYGFQIAWLQRAGFRPAAVVQANVLQIWASMVVSGAAGLAYLFCLGPASARELAAVGGVGLAFFVWVSIAHNARFLGLVLAVLNRVSSKTFELPVLPRVLWWRLLAYFAAVHGGVGLGACCFAGSFGFQLDPRSVLAICASVAVADAVGFLAFMVPGGLGVREGVLFAMTRGLAGEQFGLVLPVVTRLGTMLAEFVLFLVSLGIFYSSRPTGASDLAATDHRDPKKSRAS